LQPKARSGVDLPLHGNGTLLWMRTEVARRNIYCFSWPFK